MSDTAYRRDDGAIVIPSLFTDWPDEVVRPGSRRYAMCAQLLAHLEADRHRPPAPACPACESTETGYMLWGELGPDTYAFVTANTLIGGCCTPRIGDRDPQYGCESCGAVFDDAGQFIPEHLTRYR